MSVKGFPKDYWDKNYEDLEDMDGIGNSAQHALYVKSFFDIEYVQVNSIADYGFGLGYLFEEFMRKFEPYRAFGIEPSKHAFDDFNQRDIIVPLKTKLRTKNIDLLTWARQSNENEKITDLGICTSVFQYLEDEEIEEILPVLAEKVRYLYFSAPTARELRRQASDLEFVDEYAIHRSRKKYLKMLAPHFTIIGSRILESKVHFDRDNTPFTDLIFRF